jgi:uncharacterized membrane protein (UPF0136 family)
MSPVTVLWIYIAFLLIGGVVGFVKGKSKVSLIMALVFGGLLTLCALGIITIPWIADVLLALLVITFGMRLAKTRKFMPSGMLLIVTVLALVFRNVILK